MDAFDQKGYIDSISLITEDCSFSQFRSHRAMFAWIGLTRPDVAFAINRSSQVTEKIFEVGKIR